MGAASSIEVQETVANSSGITIEALLALPRNNTNLLTNICQKHAGDLWQWDASNANNDQLRAGLWIILIVFCTFPLLWILHHCNRRDRVGFRRHRAANVLGLVVFAALYGFCLWNVGEFQHGIEHRFYCEVSPDWSVFKQQRSLYLLSIIFGYFFPLWLVCSFVLAFAVWLVGMMVAWPVILILGFLDMASGLSKWPKRDRDNDVELQDGMQTRVGFHGHSISRSSQPLGWDESTTYPEAAHVHDPPPQYTEYRFGRGL